MEQLTYVYSLRIAGSVAIDPIDKDYTAFNRKSREDADNEAKAWAARQLSALYPVFFAAFLYGKEKADEVSVYVATFRAEVQVRESKG